MVKNWVYIFYKNYSLFPIVIKLKTKTSYKQNDMFILKVIFKYSKRLYYFGSVTNNEVR